MKVSEITVAYIVQELKLDGTDYIAANIQAQINAAKAFIRSYTGLDDTAIDTHEEFTHAVCVLCQDMIDNKVMYVEKNNLNKVVETILGMHCVNFL